MVRGRGQDVAALLSQVLLLLVMGGDMGGQSTHCYAMVDSTGQA